MFAKSGYRYSRIIFISSLIILSGKVYPISTATVSNNQLKNSEDNVEQVASTTIPTEQLIPESQNASEISSSERSVLSQEDITTKDEWGGNCNLGDWNRCKVTKVWFVSEKYDLEHKDIEADCSIEPVLCMKNGWSVNRCHILCMGQCNKELLNKWDKYVAHEGECKAHAHG